MKNLICLLILNLCLSITAQAQQKEGDDKYLSGAVPEVNGKVVFSKDYEMSGTPKDEIFAKVTAWMKNRLSKNENNSRVVYTNLEKGQVVGVGEEWIVFKSTALSLDRTKIHYQLTSICSEGHCTLKIEKIRFDYRNGEENYVAEEWISDKYALNKSKTKLIRGLAKWRRKTVDFAEDMQNDLGRHLGVASPVDIPSQDIPQKTANNQDVSENKNLAEIPLSDLSANAISMGKGTLVLSIGEDMFNMTTLTAKAGGSIGKQGDKYVVFSFLSPDQPYDVMEKAEKYTVRFYPTGETNPSIVLECKKMDIQQSSFIEGQPRMYIGEIVKAFSR